MVSQSPLRVPYAMRNAGPAAGVANVLTREASGNDVHRFESSPVDPGDVADVRRTGEVCRQQPGDVSVRVSHPHDRGAEDVLHGHIEAAVASTEGAEAEVALSAAAATF